MPDPRPASAADATQELLIATPAEVTREMPRISGAPPVEGEPIEPAEPAPVRERPTGSARSALFWAYSLTVARFGVTGIVTLVLAKFVEPRAYGVMALAMVWVTFAQAMAQNGPAQAVVQRDHVTDRHFDAAFWSTLAGSAIMAAIFAGAAPFWAAANGTPELTVVCWALAPAIVLNAFVLVPDAILRRQMQFKRLSIRVMVASLISGVAGIVAAVLGLGVWALVIQQLVLTVISAIVVSAIAQWRPRLRRVGRELRDIRVFSLHSVSVYVAFFLSTRTDALMLGVFFGPLAIGLYRFSVRITDMITDVSVGGLGQISLPHLSRYTVDRAEFARRLGQVLHAGAVLSTPAFGILFACAGPFLAFLGPQWTPAVPALQALCLAGMGGALGTIVAPALQAAGRPGLSAAIGWTKAAVTAVAIAGVGILYRTAAPEQQVFGIALAFGVIHVGFGLACLLIVFRWVVRAPAGPALRPAVPAMVAAGIASLAGLAVRALTGSHPPLVSLLLTGAVAACLAAVVLLVFDTEVSRMARRILRVVVPSARRA